MSGYFSLLMLLLEMAWHVRLVVDESEVAFEDEVEDLRCVGERPVGGKEDVDKGTFEFPSLRGGQALHELLQRPRLQEPHPHSLPLQVGDVIVVSLLLEYEGQE